MEEEKEAQLSQRSARRPTSPFANSLASSLAIEPLEALRLTSNRRRNGGNFDAFNSGGGVRKSCE